MAVYVKTNNSKELLDKIKKAIDEGKIDTWKYDKDGDFYHTPEQWEHSGWLRPHPLETFLVFGIITPKGEEMSKVTYAVYHGRFIEMLLNHFDVDSDWIYASTQKTNYDIF